MIFLESNDNNNLETIKPVVHFTYKSTPDMTSLCQGDLLKTTDELKQVLKEVHPYFLNTQYKYFIVLTQSCDLVRRYGNLCKTPYITLAAVRDFDDFLENQLIRNKYAEKFNNLLLMDDKSELRAEQFVERLYNNTEPDYFFLYKDDSLSLQNSLVASLKVSIALKSELHYQKCLDAKMVELSDEFKAKLGWLVGNIYSRVGTTDWESLMSAREKRAMIQHELSSHCIISSKRKLTEFKKCIDSQPKSISSITEAAEYIESIKIETAYDQAMNALDDIINTADRHMDPEIKNRIIRKIHSSSKLKSLIPSV